MGIDFLFHPAKYLGGVSGNLSAYLCFSAVLFVFGLIAALSRRSAIGIFMGIELILNAAALNFVAFQVLKKDLVASNWLHGHMFSLFIIIIAAIEAAVALAIILRVFGSKGTINSDRISELKG
jgi:NADH:ubiquinone oxidoreductase subunit K